jgi:hypothetical protein
MHKGYIMDKGSKLRPLLGHERMRIDLTMQKLDESLNLSIRKQVMRELRADLKVMIGATGNNEPVVVDGGSVDEIVDVLMYGSQVYAVAAIKNSFSISEGGTA